MIAAILSGLGLGGLGLAMIFIPGVRGAVFAGLRFIFDLIRENPWQAALVAALLWGAWERVDAIRGWSRAAKWALHHKRHLADDQASINQAVDWRKSVETSAALLAETIKEKANAEDRLNSALADNLRLRGPGRAAAVCGPRGGARLPAATSGPVADGGPSDAPVAPVPDDEPLAIVPWNGLTRYAEDADANRTEVMAWRTWYIGQSELLKARKLELPSPAFGN